MSDNMPAIMVTGSHIPFERNGLKFYRPDGEITKHDEAAILSVEDTCSHLELKELIVSEMAAVNYISRYTSLFSTPFLKNKRMVFTNIQALGVIFISLYLLHWGLKSLAWVEAIILYL